MKIDYKYDNEKRDAYRASKAVQIMIWIILGTISSIGVLSAAIMVQLVIYLCTVIANLW